MRILTKTIGFFLIVFSFAYYNATPVQRYHHGPKHYYHGHHRPHYKRVVYSHHRPRHYYKPKHYYKVVRPHRYYSHRKYRPHRVYHHSGPVIIVKL